MLALGPQWRSSARRSAALLLARAVVAAQQECLTAAHSGSRAASSSSSSLADVVIVGAKRTPIGSFNGSMSSFTACQLGSLAIKAALESSGVQASSVQEVIMGNVISAGLGQSPARQAALGAGIPVEADCTTINKVCSSGLKAVVLGAQSIAQGVHEVVVAGGMESMSQAPYYLARRALKKKMGDTAGLKDSLLHDGLLDASKESPMGIFAEEAADEMQISRDDQDDSAMESYQRAAEAQTSGVTDNERVPVTIPARNKDDDPIIVNEDEEVVRFNPEKMRALSPAFRPDGRITAANASKISDGAAALVLTSAAFAEKNGLTVLARIRGYADAAQAPERFPTSPAVAIPRALKSAGLTLNDINLFEINEAFAVVNIANQRILGLSPDEVNVMGGAVALGHPIGASGARILVTLINALQAKNARFGVAAICNGGGGATAIVVERVLPEPEPEPERSGEAASEGSPTPPEGSTAEEKKQE